MRLERLFNEGLAQQELEKGSAKLLNLTEKDVLSEVNSADLRSLAKKSNKEFINNINYNINKNIDKLYKDYSSYQELYYDINSSTGVKSISEINHKTIQMRALKPENGVVQNFPIDTFNKNLNKVVVDLVAKETINQLVKAMKESGEKIEVDIDFESPKSLGLSSINKIFDQEIATSETTFHRGSIRSGQKIEAEGSIVIIGDLNAGGEVIAADNIIVLGSLRGLAHAGAKGNIKAIVSAGLLDTSQIRIANIIKQIDREEEYIHKLAYVYAEENKIIID